MIPILRHTSAGSATMKKLSLDALRVDSFATTPEAATLRGTVAAFSAQCTVVSCIASHRITCEISCGGTC